MAQVNDDFCDCLDGSDEPGTAACEKGQFWCRNKGFVGNYIPSSRVDDGICDCCDGSDEVKSGANCEDVCVQMREESQNSVRDEIDKHLKGAALRKEWIQQATQLRTEKEAQQVELKVELSEVESALTEAADIKAKEEQLEKAENDRIDAEWEEKMAAKREQEPWIEPEIIEPTTELTETEQQPAVIEEEFNFPYPAEYAPHASEGEASEEDDDYDEDSDFDFDLDSIELENGLGESVLNEEVVEAEQAEETEQKPAPFISEAATAAREKYNEIDSKTQKLQSDLTAIDQFLVIKFGPADELAPFYKECFSIKQNQYTYEVCLFDSASQKENHSSTKLGSFESFDVEKNEMKFTKGQRCWQGPDRSLTVRFECGEKNKVLSVNEPEKCVYSMVFATPALCSQEHAQTLEMDLAFNDDGEEM